MLHTYTLQCIRRVLVSWRLDYVITQRPLNRAEAALGEPDLHHPMVMQIQSAVLVRHDTFTQPVEQEKRLIHGHRLQRLLEHMRAQWTDELLPRFLTTNHQQVNHATFGVDDCGHTQGRTHVTPQRLVICPKLKAALKVVLYTDIQLHPTVEMACQHVNLACTGTAFFRREGFSKGLAQGVDVDSLMVQLLPRWKLDTTPCALSNFSIGLNDGLGLGKFGGPVDQRPQRPLGITDVVLKIVQHRMPQWNRVAQSLDPAHSGHAFHATQFCVDRCQLALVQGFEAFLHAGLDFLFGLRPRCPFGQFDFSGLEVELPILVAHLAHEIAIVEG